MKWGLVPSWAADPTVGNRMINARAETLLSKPSFRSLISRQRCLVPADGFFEWRREGNRKVPMWIHLKNNEPFAFAGLWDTWSHARIGDVLHTFTIITTDPNAFVRPIHNRMPVICDSDLGRQWLEYQHGGSATSLAALLRPCPAELMAAHDVADSVNAPENDSAECIRPLPPGYVQPGQLTLI